MAATPKWINSGWLEEVAIAAFDDGITWNGWACPLIPVESMPELAKVCEEAGYTKEYAQSEGGTWWEQREGKWYELMFEQDGEGGFDVFEQLLPTSLVCGKFCVRPGDGICWEWLSAETDLDDLTKIGSLS